MSKNPRELLNEFTGGLQEVGKTNGEVVNAFMGLLGSDYKAGAVDTKTKELISVAIGVFARCEYCIAFHVFKAYEAGATGEEIMEAAMVAVAFGGGPSMAYAVSLVKDSVKEFASDFKK
jgi:AhpD family alkylhydroperoxidase